MNTTTLVYTALIPLALAVISAGCGDDGGVFNETPLTIDCGAEAGDLELTVGQAARVFCPEDCAGYSIWGTDTYTDDSSICVAAIHAGALTTSGGTTQIQLVEGLDDYESTTRNEIESSSWSSWDASFVFVD